MDGAAPEPRVLVIGLDPYRVPGPWDPAPLAEAIAVGMARFADAGVRRSGREHAAGVQPSR